MSWRQFNPESYWTNPRLIAVNYKMDIIDTQAEWKSLIQKEIPSSIPHVFISAIIRQGLEELKDLIWKELNKEDL